MLSAKTKKGQMVTLAVLKKAQIEEMRLEEFYCPACKETVIIKAGKKTIPHFAHFSKSVCINKSGEGMQHQKGKLLLYSWLQKQSIDVQIEYYLPEIKQRPDLFFSIGNKKVAIEFQCVKISPEEVQKRNAGYEKMNITPIWILSAKLFDQVTKNVIRLNQYVYHMMQQYTPQTPTFLYYLCPVEEKISIVQHVYMLKSNLAFADHQIHSIHEIDLRYLFAERELCTDSFLKVWVNEKKRFRLFRQTVHGKELIWENSLYKRQLHRQNLPSLVYMPVKLQTLMRTPAWHWQSKILLDFIDELNKGAVLTEKEIMKFIRQDMHANRMYPLLRVGTHPIREYLQILCRFEVLEEIKEGVYTKSSELIYHHHIDDATDGDNELLERFMYNNKYVK